MLALFSSLGSNVEVDIAAVSVMNDPGGAPESTSTASVKVASAPATSKGFVHDTVPPSPVAGVEQVNAGPLCWVKETNVAPVGTTSVNVTSSAESGPKLATLIENAIAEPAVVSSDAVVTTDRSASVWACAAGAADAESSMAPIRASSPVRPIARRRSTVLKDCSGSPETSRKGSCSADITLSAPGWGPCGRRFNPVSLMQSMPDRRTRVSGLSVAGKLRSPPCLLPSASCPTVAAGRDLRRRAGDQGTLTARDAVPYAIAFYSGLRRGEIPPGVAATPDTAAAEVTTDRTL